MAHYGSEQNFVTLMNKKAAALGLTNTHFENATGLHHNNIPVLDFLLSLETKMRAKAFSEIELLEKHGPK